MFLLHTTFSRLGALLIAASLIVTSACSAPTNSNNEKQAEKQANKPQKAAKDIKGMLTEGPGQYAGDKYDAEKLKKMVSKWPKDMSGEEAYSRLIQLVAEDYEPYVKRYDALDPKVQLDKKGPNAGAGPDGKTAKKLNVAVLVDSSGSMAGKVNGGVKMDLAKQAVKEFASQLPEGVNVSLQVYGHKGTNSKADKVESCKSTEEVYPMGPYNEAKFNKSLNQFKPAGWTPLAASIRSAKESFPSQSGENVENLIYVVSDGVETCDGDPVKEAKTLNQSNVKAVVNIIGFDVDSQAQEALKKAAEAGGGTYETVNTADDLQQRLEEEKERLKKEWWEWAEKNYDKNSNESYKKLDELRDINDGMREKYRQENDRLHELKDVLSGKLEDYWKLDELIKDRFWKLDEYNIDRFKKLEKARKDSFWDNESYIKDKYDRNTSSGEEK
jgi:Ca-activated chloride channel homolog